MKIVLILLLSASLLQQASGQSSFVSDLERLRSQQVEEIAAATDPIYRRYKEALEELLRKATRNGDVDAAVSIREVISTLPGSILTGKQPPTGADELSLFLHGTTWDISEGSPSAKVKYSFTFNKNGTFESSDGRSGKFTVTARDSFKLWDHDPTTLNGDFNQFKAVGTAATYYGKLRAIEQP